jgi:hypothetical protein
MINLSQIKINRNANPNPKTHPFFIGCLAFLPLFLVTMVILPLLFPLSDFAPAFSDRNSGLPLFRYEELTTLNLW